MSEQIAYKVSTPNGIVDVLGVKLGEHFAWTQTVYQTGPSVKGEVLIHVPTGMMLFNTSKQRTARHVSKALEALKVDWAETDQGKLASYVMQEMGVQGPDGVTAWFAARAEIPKKVKASPVERLLNSPVWKGAQIIAVVEHAMPERLSNKKGACHDRACQREHRKLLPAGMGKDPVMHHIEIVKCHQIQHPSGAVAYVRVDSL